MFITVPIISSIKKQAKVKSLMTTFDSAMKAKIPEDILATIRMVVVDRLNMMIKNMMIKMVIVVLTVMVM